MATSVQRFYHAVQGSTMVLPSGRILCFFGGYIDVEEGDKEAAEELGKIVDKPGTMIVSEQARAVLDKSFEQQANAVKDKAAKDTKAVADSSAPK